MKNLRFHLGDQEVPIQVAEKGGRLEFYWDGARMPVDIEPGQSGMFLVLYDGHPLEAQVRILDGQIEVVLAGKRYLLGFQDHPHSAGSRGRREASAGVAEVRAPMPGKVVKLLLAPGEPVEAGQGVLLFEAMKMQNEIRSPVSGELTALAVAEGQAVDSKEVLFRVGPVIGK